MTALRFVLSFILVSVPLTWIWVEGGWNTYAQILKSVGDVVYSLVGLDGVRLPARDRYINMIPFIALVLATPRIVLRRRILGLVTGVAVLFASHLVINAIAELSGSTRAMPPVVGTFSDTLPLAIWVVIARHFIRDLTQSVTAPLREARSSDENRQQ